MTDPELLARLEPGRTQTGQQVGRPAAQGLRDLDATADGQVVANALGRRLDDQLVALGQGERAVRRSRPTVDQQPRR
jgi:hypothetical protein